MDMPSKTEFVCMIDDRTDIVCSGCGARFNDEIVCMTRDFEGRDWIRFCPVCGKPVVYESEEG